MSQAKHEDFRVGGFISLWLGNLNTEDEMDDYLGDGFENDFGFQIYTPDGPEGDVNEEGLIPIHELLIGFSRGESFVELGTEAAKTKGWDEATSALVFYNFRYDPKFINPDFSGLFTFIGAFPYSGFGS